MAEYTRVPGFRSLLKQNRNFRYAWTSQVISEIGDHFNNIAVFSLALATTRSGLVVSGVMLARAVSAVLAAPVAGVVLDRFDRRTVMIASDLIRAVVAIAFIATIHQPRPWLLYTLSALLMFASPFFTSGRSAHPAVHRQRRRAAHGQLADADDAVDDADHWDRCGRVQRGGVRLPDGVCPQLRVVSGERVGDLEGEARTPPQSRRPTAAKARRLHEDHDWTGTKSS